jgi:carboxymethylenebutenolidase
MLAAALCALLCGTAQAALTEAQQQSRSMAAMHHDDAPVASPAVQPVAPGSVEGSTVAYGTVKGQALKGYFAKPAKAAPGLPGVIVFHEWWGLNDNIRAMADRLAAQGYLVLAADMFGGQVATAPDQAENLMGQALGDGPAIDANVEAAYAWLKDTAKAGRIGTLGWCFGGSISFEAGQQLGARSAATVIYYGFVNDHADALAKMKAPVLGLFGGQDGGISVSTVQAFQKGLEARGQHPQVRIYPQAGHAFANPSGRNYRKDDAEDAWKRTVDFLAQNLQ